VLVPFATTTLTEEWGWVVVDVVPDLPEWAWVVVVEAAPVVVVVDPAAPGDVVAVVEDVTPTADDGVLTLGRVPTATSTATATTKTTRTAAALGTDTRPDDLDGGPSDSTTVQPAVRLPRVQAFQDRRGSWPAGRYAGRAPE
jgi:hypothetical protein